MPAHPRCLGAAALVAVALLGASCGRGAAGGATTGASAATPELSTGPSAPSTAVPADEVGRAHRAALGLIALGALGTGKGVAGGRVATDARAVDGRVRALATDAGLALGDDLDAPTQALLTDLGSRTGPAFDESWRGAVRNLTRQARDAATPIRDADLLARLDALDGALSGPTAVPAGSGGDAAGAPVLPAALIGLGGVLLAAAVRLRRAGR